MPTVACPRTRAAYVRSTSRDANQLLQQRVRLRRARHDEQSRGVAVEAVHDAGPIVVVASLGAVREQALDERSGAGRSGRMDDDPCRLVDHEQVLVLPHDRDVERFGLEHRRTRDVAVTSSPPSSR